jgi:hypothetical protein
MPCSSPVKGNVIYDIIRKGTVDSKLTQLMRMTFPDKTKRILFFGFLFVVILSVFHLTYSFCDVGSCVRYKVEIIFNDGSQQTGYIQIASFDPMLELNNELFFAYLRKDAERRNLDSFTLYKGIQTIEFPRLESQTFGFKYSAAVKEDIFSVDPEEMKGIHLHEICPCEHGDISELKTRRPEDVFLIHYHHWVIEELTQVEIDLLQTEPVFTIDRESPLSVEGIDRLYVFCYDPSILESDFNRLASGLYSNLSSDKESPQKSWEENIRHYKQVKEELRKKKIIALIVRGYN